MGAAQRARPRGLPRGLPLWPPEAGRLRAGNKRVGRLAGCALTSALAGPEHALLSSRPLLEKPSRRLAQCSSSRRAGIPSVCSSIPPPFLPSLQWHQTPSEDKSVLAPMCGSEDARALTSGAHGSAGEDTQALLWGHPRRWWAAWTDILQVSSAKALHEEAPRGLSQGRQGLCAAQRSGSTLCPRVSARRVREPFPAPWHSSINTAAKCTSHHANICQIDRSRHPGLTVRSAGGPRRALLGACVGPRLLRLPLGRLQAALWAGP